MAHSRADLQQALTLHPVLAIVMMSRAVCSLPPQGPIQAELCACSNIETNFPSPFVSGT